MVVQGNAVLIRTLAVDGVGFPKVVGEQPAQPSVDQRAQLGAQAAVLVFGDLQPNQPVGHVRFLQSGRLQGDPVALLIAGAEPGQVAGAGAR